VWRAEITCAYPAQDDFGALLVKAAIFRGVGVPLEISAHPDPEPGAHEVVLKVGRCGICGTDLHMTENGAPNTPKLGAVIGHEISGEIVARGSGVTHLKVGDRVAALPIAGCGACTACRAGEPTWCVNGLNFLGGGYAEYARAGANECLKLPGGLTLEDGALVEPLAVALHGVRMAGDLSGTKVLVIGAGPIGLGAVYWARRFGASRIDVIEGNPARRTLAMELGATAATAPATAPPPGLAPGPAADLPDVVIECVGKPGLLATAITKVRPRGIVLSLGFCMSPEQFVAAMAASREVTLKFPILYSLSDYQMTLDALNAGDVAPRAMVTDTVSLEALPTVFESLRAPSHQCKVMIDPWRS
jgi:(R,R)-butanediol dehydrogenase/meso-butanediol dehydrogenase/diacetyl reductase